MPSYAALTVSGGTTITSAWGNNMRDSGIPTCTSGTRPGSPHEGMLVYETDTHRYASYNGSTWIYVLFSTSGRGGCSVGAPLNAASGTSHSTGALSLLYWSTTSYDPDGMHGGFAENITIPFAGSWLFTVDIVASATWSWNGDFLQLQSGGGLNLGTRVANTNTGNLGATFGPIDLTSGTIVKAYLFQNSGSSKNITSGNLVCRQLSA